VQLHEIKVRTDVWFGKFSLMPIGLGQHSTAAMESNDVGSNTCFVTTDDLG
jgi:hypothetical protein